MNNNIRFNLTPIASRWIFKDIMIVFSWCIPANYMCKSYGNFKHPSLGGKSSNIPVSHIDIECLSILKHPIHVDDDACVPSTYVLIKLFGGSKRPFHEGNRWYIPSTDIIIEHIGIRNIYPIFVTFAVFHWLTSPLNKRGRWYWTYPNGLNPH